MSAKEKRISEIIDEHNVSHDTAESLFYNEITEKYGTDDFDVAESLFELDKEDESEVKV